MVFESQESIIPVDIVGILEKDHLEEAFHCSLPYCSHPESPFSVETVVITLSNGVQISKQYLSYVDLCRLIEKLEVLCWRSPVWRISTIFLIFTICVTVIPASWKLFEWVIIETPIKGMFISSCQRMNVAFVYIWLEFCADMSDSEKKSFIQYLVSESYKKNLAIAVISGLI